ncbi:MAG: hypothetical protein KIH01_07550 [Candidatus Freyarchaeota archaeon]|nr:hypothetical protein [Candidatus Jordarchaeia archaeon]
MRSERDRDFLKTSEGFFFCVVGYEHPPDRVLAYLKYVPSSSGKWGSTARFHRVLVRYDAASVADTFSILERYPKYLFYSEVYGVTFSAVPKNEIVEKYYPEVKVASLLVKRELDSLQSKAISLIQLLSSESGVLVEKFGVTGSILIDIHNPSFSDIDLTVYGKENALNVKEALLNLRGRAVTPFMGDAAEEWIRKKEGVFQLSRRQAQEILKRKWNIGFYDGTRFSIHPVKDDAEIKEVYGERVYRSLGFCTIKATVASCSDALFLPCRYEVEDVVFLEGKPIEGVREVVSYEGLFCDILEEGEKITVHGKLERVEGKGGDHYRVLVGSQEAKAKDFIHTL